MRIFSVLNELQYRRLHQRDGLPGTVRHALRLLSQRLARQTDKLATLQADAVKIDEAIGVLDSDLDISMTFDPVLWRILVEQVPVETDGTVRFQMVGGKEYRFQV